MTPFELLKNRSYVHVPRYLRIDLHKGYLTKAVCDIHTHNEKALEAGVLSEQNEHIKSMVKKKQKKVL